MRFTVVIPTRERCDTLRSTLSTCLSQEFDGLEILVSDNLSQDSTREVVEAMRDPRIRYVNTGARLSMTRNWEFALGHVRPGFVTFLGDDDGLMPHAVRDAAALLTESGNPALSWRKAEYSWPSHPQPAWRNKLSIPLTRGLVRSGAKEIANDAARFRIPYNRCPMIYNSFVDLRVVHELRAATGGQFFHSVVPDVYSGFAILSRITSYDFSLRPLSVNGASGHSTGSHFGLPGSQQSSQQRFFAEADIPQHPALPVVRGSMISAIGEPLLQANDRCFGGRLPIDRGGMIQRIFRELEKVQADRWASVVEQLEAALSSDAEALRLIARYRERYPNRPEPYGTPSYGLDERGVLVIDASRFGVQDIEGACRLVADLLEPADGPPQPSRYSRLDKYVSRLFRAAARAVGDRSL